MSKRRIRKRSCTSKKKYLSEGDAAGVVRRMRKRGAQRIEMQYIKEMSTPQLYKSRYRCQAWIDGPENDGRLTFGSSACLDYFSDEIEVIDKELVARGEFKVFPERYPFILGLDWRPTYKSLWLGWWLITWTIERYPWRIRELSIEFQPGL